MDWKEAAKWVGILVAAGLISAVIEVLIEERIRGTARAEARAEVDRVVSAALEQIRAQQLPVKAQTSVSQQIGVANII